MSVCSTTQALSGRNYDLNLVNRVLKRDVTSRRWLVAVGREMTRNG